MGIDDGHRIQRIGLPVAQQGRLREFHDVHRLDVAVVLRIKYKRDPGCQQPFLSDQIGKVSPFFGFHIFRMAGTEFPVHLQQYPVDPVAHLKKILQYPDVVIQHVSGFSDVDDLLTRDLAQVFRQQWVGTGVSGDQIIDLLVFSDPMQGCFGDHPGVKNIQQ